MRSKHEKISKGYRLRPETHELIRKIQILINSNQDTVIGRACKKYYKELLIKEHSHSKFIRKESAK